MNKQTSSDYGQFDLTEDSFLIPNDIILIALSRWSRQPYRYLRDFLYSTKSISPPSSSAVASALNTVQMTLKFTPESKRFPTEERVNVGFSLPPEEHSPFPPSPGWSLYSPLARTQHTGQALKRSHQFWLSEGAAVLITLIIN